MYYRDSAYLRSPRHHWNPAHLGRSLYHRHIPSSCLSIRQEHSWKEQIRQDSLSFLGFAVSGKQSRLIPLCSGLGPSESNIKLILFSAYSSRVGWTTDKSRSIMRKCGRAGSIYYPYHPGTGDMPAVTTEVGQFGQSKPAIFATLHMSLPQAQKIPLYALCALAK